MAEETTLTRSKVLKRAAVGAAAVWSVPFLTSTASASVGRTSAGPGACSKAGPGGEPKAVPSCDSLCGAPSCGTKNGKGCFCFPGAAVGHTSGCCVCNGNISCSNSPACSRNSDCPSGWKCTFNCCQTFPNSSCVPPCGQGLAVASGRTAAG
jgi:hypothetical protein